MAKWNLTGACYLFGLLAAIGTSCSGSSNPHRAVQAPLPGPSVARSDVFSECTYAGHGALDRHVTAEPSAAVGGPADAPLMVALYYQGTTAGAPFDGGLGFGLAVSQDRGATWTDHPVPFGSCAEDHSPDTVGSGRVSVGPDGTIYVAAMAGDGESPIRLVLIASPDSICFW